MISRNSACMSAIVAIMVAGLGATLPAFGQQGGDNCMAPSVLHDPLPIQFSGTTVGYADDYDEVCPFVGSIAPDVVYSYAPTADVTVDISLCGDETDFDTKLYVYEDLCPDPGEPYACNDDACYTPSGQGMVSRIRQLPLLADHTYYIVVDGFGAAAGNYELELTESPTLPDCDGGLVMRSQPPELENWVAVGRDTRAERFDNLPGRITAVRFWGLNFNVVNGDWGPAPLEPMEFTVRVREILNGEPGYEIALLNLDLMPTVVGTVGPHGWEVLEYYTELSPAPFAQDCWISIEGPDHTGGDPAVPFFAWMESCVGDGESHCCVGVAICGLSMWGLRSGHVSVYGR